MMRTSTVMTRRMSQKLSQKVVNNQLQKKELRGKKMMRTIQKVLQNQSPLQPTTLKKRHLRKNQPPKKANRHQMTMKVSMKVLSKNQNRTIQKNSTKMMRIIKTKKKSGAKGKGT